MKQDILVIGAGIIGTSIAYHLAKVGCHVHLVDASYPAQTPSATWASAGGLRSQGRSGDERPLTRLAKDRWQTLADELDADIEISFGGHLHVAEDDEQAKAIDDRVAADQAAGLSIDRLDGVDIQNQFPVLSKQIIAGAFTSGDGQAHPGRTACAYVEAAKRIGATTGFGDPVTHLLLDERSIKGVALASGENIQAQMTILACGAWANRLLKPFGSELPVRNRGLQMQLSDVAVKGTLAPTVTAVGRNLSLKQLRSGAYMLGGRWESLPDEKTLVATPSASDLKAQWAGAQAILPQLKFHQPVQNWSGTEAQSIDHQPFIGPLNSKMIEHGLYVAFGFSNHGFQISPAIGQLVAEAVTSGATPNLLTPLSPNRANGFDQEAIFAFCDQQSACGG